MNRFLPFLAAALFAATPAAAQVAPVTFTVDVDGLVPLADCAIEVAPGSDALDVLDAAVALGCIRSYQTQTFAFGTLVTCIDDVCMQCDPPAYSPCTFWSFIVNGDAVDYGVEAYRAASGDGVTFTYSVLPLWVLDLVALP